MTLRTRLVNINNDVSSRRHSVLGLGKLLREEVITKSLATDSDLVSKPSKTHGYSFVALSQTTVPLFGVCLRDTQSGKQPNADLVHLDPVVCL